MHVRPARLEDAASIAELHVRSWQAAYAAVLAPDFLASLNVAERTRRWAELLQAAQSSTDLALQEDRLLAFVSHGHCRDDDAPAGQGEIWALYAHPQAWGAGAGRRLLDHALAALRADGHDEVKLWVLTRNLRAIRFYESAGFARVPDSEKTFDLGGTRVEEAAYRRGLGP